MNGIIDKPSSLINLSGDELAELLLDDKYNKTNLRELVKKCIHMCKVYKDMSDNHRLEKEQYCKRLEKVKSILDGEDD